MSQRDLRKKVVVLFRPLRLLLDLQIQPIKKIETETRQSRKHFQTGTYKRTAEIEK